jgi:acyl transferase domain-containing protein/acyl-CoA synthetase (AMP-forming)/AMP-acid ligase II/acyl carrier protein
MASFQSIVDILRRHADEDPARRFYTFLADDETEAGTLTRAETDQRARAIAALLQESGAGGERALILLPQGLDFIVSFFGCLYAGITAIPAFPPRAEARHLARIAAIVQDSGARVVLTSTAILEAIRPWFASFPGAEQIRWITADDADPARAERWRPVELTADTVAFLQYTSGSTSTPKGVMVTHGNILHNTALIHEAMRLTPDAVAVSWLPLFHDMGLIGGILLPSASGIQAVLMSPAAFLQKPVRWLNAITKYRGTGSPAPNFAYQLCVSRVTDEQCAGLDLSSWTAAINGAEPVRADTLDAFCQRFGPFGFRPETLQPTYGLAEATLIVSGGRDAGAPPLVCMMDPAEMEAGRAREAADEAPARALVGCGRVLEHGQRVAIADPDTGVERAPGEVGEIWVMGPSVAAGYWNRPAETAETFGARLATGEGPFMRTGDLGFVHGGELFVAGRRKDLIIIRGRNHYPQDVEVTVERAHPAVRPSCVAAFPVEVDGEEELVVVAELKREAIRDRVDPAGVAAAVREAIVREHELRAHAVVLLRTATISKTSSGKIQRRASRDLFLAGGLAPVHMWRSTDPASRVAAAEAAAEEAPRHAPSPGARAIEAWLVARLAEITKIPAREIDRRVAFAAYGLDSVASVSLSGELGEWLGRPLEPTLLYEHPSIGRLAVFLAEEGAGEAPVALRAAAGVAEPVAIVGIGCRVPGADGPERFWELLAEGRDAVTEVPGARWDAAAFFNAETRAGKMNTRWGGFLEGVDRFDAGFFGIAPREAARMDPQQRLLLETAWEALEDAGVAPDALAGTATGVFVGISATDYGQLQFADPSFSDAYAGTGSALSIAANRLSYVLDLRGPSMAVDTACSSSLVALHLACRSLAAGECTTALAAGVNLVLSPSVTVNFSQAGFMSPDGRCKAFDARADGYVRSEGAGVVVLKPLSRALADGDRVYAVIRGSAVNQDGRSNGLTAPSRLAQEAVLREAYLAAGVSPSAVEYVEAHGTGTSLGDPIEARALGTVVGAGRPAARPCAIGSVKTNLGHLEAAAGVMGVIKTALSLHHEARPATLHFQSPNPAIPFGELALRVQAAHEPWPRAQEPRTAGVSSFGFGGTNAHVVLEEAPALPAVDAAGEDPPVLLALSARAPGALAALAAATRDALRGPAAGTAYDVARTAALRRAHHDHRLAVAGASAAELADGLDRFVAGEASPRVHAGRRAAGGQPRVAFVFTGQGSQWTGMARGLLASDAEFRAELERIDNLLAPLAGWSVLSELAADEGASRIHETVVAQGTLFAVQVALASLWERWGIVPAAVAGHSVGEVAAACVAGALSLEDAVRLIHHRGRLMQRATGGSMAATGLGAAAAAEVASRHPGVSVAAVNSPRTTVLSGERAALEAALAGLEAEGVFVRRLPVDYAFHSAQMEPFARELAEVCAGIVPRAGRIPFISTVTGAAAPGESLGAAYWARNVRDTVRFGDAVDALLADGVDVFLEIGPHPSLAGALGQCLSASGSDAVVAGSLRQGEDDAAALLSAAGALYARGASLAWPALFPREGRPAALPRYPWQRERHWLHAAAPAPAPAASPEAPGTDPLLGARHGAAHAGVHFWESDVGAGAAPCPTLAPGDALPCSVLLGMVWSAAGSALGAGRFSLRGFQQTRTLVLPGTGSRRVQVVLTPALAGAHDIRVFSREPDAGAAWELHAAGTLAPVEGAGA